jgi:branched-chain amino acid transport system permease protein
VTGYIYLLWGWIRNEILAIPGRIIAVVFFLSLLSFPLFIQETYYLRIIILATIFSLFAASWDLLSGFTGQLNLGHALFFGVAAYGAALINIHFDMPPWITIPLGGIGAVLVGLIAGIPALRLRGFYLGLVTLSFPLILTGLIFVFPDFTGGELGLSGVDRLSSSRIVSYYTIVIVFAISVLFLWKFSDAKSKLFRVGVLLHAIREDEIAARAAGINTTHYKLLAFAVSGFFAGIAGGLYAHFLRIAGPSTLDLFFSFQAILWTIFGGIATIYGAVAGVFILYPLVEFLSLYTLGEELRYVFFCVILIIFLLFMPEGITVWVLDKIEIKCPRCKVINVFTRQTCRACRARLRLDKRTEETGGKKL